MTQFLRRFVERLQKVLQKTYKISKFCNGNGIEISTRTKSMPAQTRKAPKHQLKLLVDIPAIRNVKLQVNLSPYGSNLKNELKNIRTAIARKKILEKEFM